MKTYEYIRPSTQERVTVETIKTDIQDHDFDLNFEYFIPELDEIVSIQSVYGGTVKTECGKSIYITDYSFYRIIQKRKPTEEEWNNSIASYYTVRDFLGPTDEEINKLIAYHWTIERESKGEQKGFYKRKIKYSGSAFYSKVNIYPLSFLESLVERGIIQK